MTKTLQNFIKRHGPVAVLMALAEVEALPVLTPGYESTNKNREDAAHEIRQCAITVKWILRR